MDSKLAPLWRAVSAVGSEHTSCFFWVAYYLGNISAIYLSSVNSAGDSMAPQLLFLTLKCPMDECFTGASLFGIPARLKQQDL